MPAQPIPQPGLRKLGALEKAQRLIAEGRVSLDPDARVYPVRGDTPDSLYRVIASPQGIFCPCQARTPLCKHVIAVAILRQHDQALSALEEVA